jgi:TolB-like protein
MCKQEIAQMTSLSLLSYGDQHEFNTTNAIIDALTDDVITTYHTPTDKM